MSPKAQHAPGPLKLVSHPRIAMVKSELSIGSGSNGMASVAWVTGASPNASATAAELVRRWNAHDGLVAERADLLDKLTTAMSRQGLLVAALEQMIATCVVSSHTPEGDAAGTAAFRAARAALAVARGGQ